MEEKSRSSNVPSRERDLYRAPGEYVSQSLHLELEIRDPEVIKEITAYPEGRNRLEFAQTCLKIGVLALKQAEGQIDAYAVRNEGEKLLATMQHQLENHRQTVTEQVSTTLREYFDPNSGRFQERLTQLLKKDGELEQILRAQVGAEDSVIAQTLARHMGETSPIFKMLSPTESDGIINSMTQLMSDIMKSERDRILGEFSLDQDSSALSRLVRQLNEHNLKTAEGLTQSINEVVGEFSLDKDDSALSRLVNQVQAAQKKISEEFTLDSDVSALARIKKELVGVLDTHKEQNQKFQQEVIQQLTALKTRKEESAKSTLHGNDFEDALYAMIAEESGPAGDVATSTGNTTGLIKNSKVGDVVVEIGREHVAAGAKIVVEAKDSMAYDLRKALDEIEVARKNRGAGIGIFVFSLSTAPEGLDGLQRYGNDIVAVWDMDDPRTDVFPKAAFSIAKALSIQVADRDEESQVDLEVIEKSVLAIEKQTEGLAEITRWAETAKSSGDKIINKARILGNNLDREIAALNGQLMVLKNEKG